MDKLCVWVLLLSVTAGQCADNTGYLLTIPKIVQAGADETFCLTLHGIEEDAEFTLSLVHKEKDDEFDYTYTFREGLSKCETFPVPTQPGTYEVALKNATDVISVVREIEVKSGNLITLIQTDKPFYRPGEAVKFRILTMKRDLKSRKGKIEEILIKTPNEIRVKQWLNVLSDGLASFNYPMPKEPKLGEWTIEVTVDGETTTQTFKVEKYVLPKFDVTITPPVYILANADVIEGEVCASYTYGKPVNGYLILELCLWLYGSFGRPCARHTMEINGCRSFSVNSSEMSMKSLDYHLFGSELHILATVRERDTGLEVNKTHKGPKVTFDALKIVLEDDTSGYFKPMFPYQGRVIVTNPDGTVAPNELIEVNMVDYHNDIRVARNFTTNDNGVVMFTVCDVLTDKTIDFSIEAKALLYSVEDHELPMNKLYMPRAYRSIKQWYSPSHSYIVIPRDQAVHRCGEEMTVTIPYSTTLNSYTTFYYQVVARGRIQHTSHKTHHFLHHDSTEYLEVPEEQCLLPVEEEELPSTPPPTPGAEATPPPPQSKTEEGEESIPSEMFVAEPMIVPEMYHQLGGVRRKRSSVLSSEGETVEEGESRTEETDEEPMMVLPPIKKSEHISHFTIRFPLTAEMSPKASLLVYYVREDGETVADSIDFNIESCFENKVKFEFQDESVVPGGETTLNLEATPGSVCSIGVVDKSVNIIGGDHQLTPEKVFEKLASYNLLSGSHSYYSDRDYCEDKIKKEEATSNEDTNKAEEPSSEAYFGWWHYSSRYVDAIQAFKQMGLQVITNLVLETRPCSKEYPIYYDFGVQMSSRAFAMTSEVHNVEQTVGKPKTDLRSFFPESWLWDLKIVGDNGRLSVPLTAPHTITKWVGNSICVSDTAGLGISPLAAITTFQPFFLSFTLPYAAVRGERIPIMVTVYNYLEKCLHIQVNLEMSRDISVIVRKHQKLPFCLCGGKTWSQTYYMEPKHIGDLPITATAEIVPGMCGNSLDMDQKFIGLKDAVRREIFVKAEGITQEYTKSLYICPKGSGALNEEVELSLPRGVVPDSARGHISVIGDMMGPALSNLDHLIELPTGCGEQTMISFTPNIYVLKYLTSTGQLTEDIEMLTKKYMEIGYNRELNYRHPDGSFSAFGENDDSGSTWLTAFVVKSFAGARDFMYIDQMDLEQSITFLKTTAMENGCFHEVGKMFSSYMMGGIMEDQDDTALTAFVLIALLEANVPQDDRVLKGAMDCLNRQPLDEMDVYTLAIVSYVNVLSDPTNPHTDQAMDELHRRIKSNGLLKHWSRTGSTPHMNNIYHMAASAEVETTAYGLLATLGYYGDKAITKGQPIVLWLSQQRNAFGGFSSTQDTVVGLNALSEFASRLFVGGNKTDLTVRVHGQRLDRKFKIKSGVNTLLLQSVPMPSLPKTITISANGTGCALVQANVRYNQIPKNLNVTDPRFHLMIEVRRAKSNKNDCTKRLLRTCVGYSRRQDLSSGMSMVTVKMVTGWTPTEESLRELRSVYAILSMKRHEYNEKEAKLVFYFDEMDARRRCFDFEVEQNRELAVSAPKPADVQVFQYYEKDVTIIKSYKIKTTCGTKAEIPLESDQRVDFIVPVQIRSGGQSPPVSRPVRKRITKFLSKPTHLTIKRGEVAILPCAVKNLGSKIVIWKKMMPAKLISRGKKIVVPSNRFYMRRPGKNLSSPEWNLHIRDVQMNDSGIYECQIGAKQENFFIKITLNVTGPVASMKKPETPIGCPICLATRPDDFRDIVCKSDAVYKVISGRNGKLPMKIKANLRTRRKQKLDIFVNFTIAENCICSLINPPRSKNRGRRVKRILVLMKNVTLSEDTKLSLDSRTYVISIDNNKSLEQEARRQVRRCKRKLT
ncbi:pregnancy zone protein-like [Gigantopelta aegis]|uniref:pregnancy zone protein-like n=1 Tax=Gigantopelta aegis TaxID=1735272 RepID=UPI001B88BED4|nr:pregnancy zone protein-like [Gigantopelta aegis]